MFATQLCQRQAGLLRPCVRAQRARKLSVRAEGAVINPSIKKDVDKVVDTVLVSSVEKQAAYCRCWRSGKFPMCDGAHAKHNKETGDNVGPLLVKNDK